MRQRHVSYGLDFHHLQHSKVGLPLVEPIQRIVVRAEILRQRWPLNGSLEHQAQRRPIDSSAVNAKPDDATSELIHNHQHPMRSQAQRFTTKQVDAPQTVLRLTEKGQPRRTAGSGFWPVMFSKNPAHHVLVDIHAESQSYLLSNSRTTPGRVTSFKFKDGIDPFLDRSLRTRPTSALGPKQPAVLSFGPYVMKMQQRRWL